MTKTTKLTRTCLACGLEKPLAAFLQITGTQGTVYGNVCSSCRSTSAKAKKNIPTIEDDARGATGITIDSKARIRMEQLHAEMDQKKETEKIAHLDKREKMILEKALKTQNKEQAEKHHREGYIEDKEKIKFTKSIEKKPEKKPLDRSFISNHQHVLETHMIEESLKQEINLVNVDTSQLFLDSQFGEIKFQSEVFKSFKTWLGTSANFRTIERLYSQKAEQSKLNANERDTFIDKIENAPKRKI